MIENTPGSEPITVTLTGFGTAPENAIVGIPVTVIEEGTNPVTACELLRERGELGTASLIERLMKERSEARYAPISADDDRLTHIWEQAYEIASGKNYCSEFRDMMDALGTGYVHEKTYMVELKVQLVAYVSIPVTCDPEDDPADHIDSDDISSYMSDMGELPDVDDWAVLSMDEV